MKLAVLRLLLWLLIEPIQCSIWKLRAVFAGCGGQVTRPGIIETTTVMGKYSDEANCTWNITAPPGHIIVLRWAHILFTKQNLYHTVHTYLFGQEVLSQPEGSQPWFKMYHKTVSWILTLTFCFHVWEAPCSLKISIGQSLIWSPACSLFLHVGTYAKYGRWTSGRIYLQFCSQRYSFDENLLYVSTPVSHCYS
jgi:hypothetical protein